MSTHAIGALGYPVAVASPVDLAAQLRDKVRLDIATMMPPDVWQGWLQAAIESFNKPTVKFDYSGRGVPSPSPLETLVHDVLKERLREDLKALLASEDFAGAFVDNREMASDFIRKLMVERAGEIMNAWIGEAFQNVLRNMQQRS